MFAEVTSVCTKLTHTHTIVYIYIYKYKRMEHGDSLGTNTLYFRLVHVKVNASVHTQNI